jgi:type IV fimbrial biogenesis protein FimT
MEKMKKLLTNRDDSGYSFMELMVVVAIIAITAAFAIPNLIGRRADVKLQGAVNNLKGDLNVARTMAVRENARVVVLFSENGYQVFVDNGSTEWNFDPGEERMVRDRQLPAGVSIDLAATDLDSDRTRFNERGLPDPGNLGTMVLVDGSGGQGQIQMNRLGRLTVQ